MNVYLTSFFKSGELPPGVEKFSAAVYQPRGYSFPKVAWTDIRDAQGWIRPRNFLGLSNPPGAYRDAMLALYDGRIQEARAWADKWRGKDVALCCWCPYDKAAKRQIEQFGSYICHTAVLSEFISSRLGIPVWEDADRRRMLPLTQKFGA